MARQLHPHPRTTNSLSNNGLLLPWQSGQQGDKEWHCRFGFCKGCVALRTSRDAGKRRDRENSFVCMAYYRTPCCKGGEILVE